MGQEYSRFFLQFFDQTEKTEQLKKRYFTWFYYSFSLCLLYALLYEHLIPIGDKKQFI